MSKPASNTIAKLVRQALPKPVLASQWEVRVVKEFDEVRAELFAGVVYVHSTWPNLVLSGRLAHVTKHHPLAVGPFREVDPMLLGERWPRSRIKRALVSHAITIERSRSRGQFTGALTVGEAFIVKAADGDEQYADRDRVLAIEKVAQEVRSKARRQTNGLTDTQDQARQFLSAINTRYFLDTGGLVPLEPYKRLLPESSLQALLRHHDLQIRPWRGLPLKVIQSQCFEAIRSMSASNIHSLMLQFAVDFSKLQPVTQETIAFRFEYGADVAIEEWKRRLHKSG